MTDQFEMFSDVVSIDKSEGTRVCRYCAKEKSLKDFAPLGVFRADGSTRLKNICKPCDNERKRFCDHIRKTLKKPPDDYCCPICLAEDKDVRGRIQDANYRHPNSQTWVVDHDRKTMTFRAWLCDHCNKGLGMFHEDVHNLRRAVNYLDKHDNNS